MIRKKTVRKSGLLALAMIMALGIWNAAVYADETDVGSVSLNITAGEHGTVNGKSGSFTETIKAGNNLTLRCAAEDGYVIGTVTVNDAELAYADLEGIIGEKAADLTVEEVTVDLSLTVTFAEAGTDAAASTETGDGENAATDVTGSEASEDATEGEKDSTDDASGETSEDEETFGDSDDEGGMLEAEGDIDEPGSLSTGEDNTDETLLDDSGKAGGEEEEQEPDGSSGDEETDGEETAGADDESFEDADQSTDGETQDEETGKAGSDEQAGKTGDESKETSGDTEKGATYSDESPKTGDEFPPSIILITLASLCTLAGIAIRQLLRKRHEEV